MPVPAAVKDYMSRPVVTLKPDMDVLEAMEIVQGGVPGSRDQLGDAALREILESGGRDEGGG